MTPEREQSLGRELRRVAAQIGDIRIDLIGKAFSLGDRERLRKNAGSPDVDDSTDFCQGLLMVAEDCARDVADLLGVLDDA